MDIITPLLLVIAGLLFLISGWMAKDNWPLRFLAFGLLAWVLVPIINAVT